MKFIYWEGDERKVAEYSDDYSLAYNEILFYLDHSGVAIEEVVFEDKDI